MKEISGLSSPELVKGPSPDRARSLASYAGGRSFLVSKRIFDIAVSLLALPLLLVICGVLLVLNPVWNKGSLFFTQRRTGKDGKDFVMIKFRSMTSAGSKQRGADDSLERHRITPLGHWLRRTKIDETPQFLNVLNGDMSLVGPRPELAAFKQTYLAEIPFYSLRWAVKPGITGYAQVIQGYTDSIEMVRQKSEFDDYYIRNMGWRIDLHILVKTIKVIFAPHSES
ncbi:sugar transferase [Leisingera aquaemixtae]|uniref:sugar transferase n=1 Tax=Leisingera TaxID=191028 RepID=UPI001C969756|nr:MULTISPECIES: sugar transferase [Leisingera]MBY6069553.1 sugar transferase [Leisingera aquaemixtae]MCB4458417.1 sugar transferase [Leisingera sp. McT4-56]